LKKEGATVILGADTGFFIQRSERHGRAIQLWQELSVGQHTLVVSALSIHELLAYFYKRGRAQQAQEWFDILTQTAGIHLISVTAEIAARSARYRLGLQLSTVDSIVLTTCLLHRCELFLTTDRDLQIAAQQNIIPVEFLP
jgi:predicted nucleic acid-binding protein